MKSAPKPNQTCPASCYKYVAVKLAQRNTNKSFKYLNLCCELWDGRGREKIFNEVFESI